MLELFTDNALYIAGNIHTVCKGYWTSEAPLKGRSWKSAKLILHRQSGITTLLDQILSLLILPYKVFYNRHTREPLNLVASSVDVTTCQIHLESFFRAKLREAQYVQVAVSISLLSNQLSPSLNRYLVSLYNERAFADQMAASKW